MKNLNVINEHYFNVGTNSREKRINRRLYCNLLHESTHENMHTPKYTHAHILVRFWKLSIPTINDLLFKYQQAEGSRAQGCQKSESIHQDLCSL